MTAGRAWAPPAVRAASRAIDDSPLPGEVEAVRTDDYLVLRWPSHLVSPTFGQVQVWVRSGRPFAELSAEVGDLARTSGVDEVWWWVDDQTPSGVGGALRAAGADETVAQVLMARTLTGEDT